MKTLLLAGIVLLLCGFADAASPRRNAETAQAMLGPRVWSRLIRIENSNHRSEYARTVYATVFELAGVLWFYTDENGTQSLSRQRDNLQAEKADLEPLLAAVDPGFTRFEVLNTGAQAEVAPDGRLLNGCFVESVAALRVRSEAGLPVARPQLLAFYLPEKLGGRGHTVLTYEADGHFNVVDPDGSSEPTALPLEAARDPAKIAAAIADQPIAKTRWVPVHDFAFAGGKWASL